MTSSTIKYYNIGALRMQSGPAYASLRDSPRFGNLLCPNVHFGAKLLYDRTLEVRDGTPVRIF